MALLSIGCGGTQLAFVHTQSAPTRLHRRSGEQVELFMTAKPTRPFMELGLVESQQEGFSDDNTRDIIAKMRAFAGRFGCDGLVIFAGNDRTSGGESLKGYRASCIVYTAAKAAESGTAAVQSGSTAACAPNATQLCYGPAGCRGGQRCAPDGRSYTICDCGAATPRTDVAQ